MIHVIISYLDVLYVKIYLEVAIVTLYIKIPIIDYDYLFDSNRAKIKLNISSFS